MTMYAFIGFGGGKLLLSLLLALFLVPLALACAGFWVWMLVDCAVNEPSEGNDKIVWILVILFASFLGAIIYFLARRPQRKAKYGR